MLLKCWTTYVQVQNIAIPMNRHDGTQLDGVLYFPFHVYFDSRSDIDSRFVYRLFADIVPDFMITFYAAPSVFSPTLFRLFRSRIHFCVRMQNVHSTDRNRTLSDYTVLFIRHAGTMLVRVRLFIAYKDE